MYFSIRQEVVPALFFYLGKNKMSLTKFTDFTSPYQLTKSLSAAPSAKSSLAITGLTTGQTYWIAIRPIDSNGNENTSNSQYSAIVN